ncbi:MAG: hypothetical protein K0R12_1073 [Gammaproteobacteria bacterium]|jgi:hypothetical protein|nr:hypothetical protein [Gammaproteobacteria bacterium]
MVDLTIEAIDKQITLVQQTHNRVIQDINYRIDKDKIRYQNLTGKYLENIEDFVLIMTAYFAYMHVPQEHYNLILKTFKHDMLALKRDCGDEKTPGILDKDLSNYFGPIPLPSELMFFSIKETVNKINLPQAADNNQDAVQLKQKIQNYNAALESLTDKMNRRTIYLHPVKAMEAIPEESSGCFVM